MSLAGRIAGAFALLLAIGGFFALVRGVILLVAGITYGDSLIAGYGAGIIVAGGLITYFLGRWGIRKLKGG